MRLIPQDATTGYYFNEQAQLDWDDRVQILLPDGSSLVIEAEQKTGRVFVHGQTNLHFDIPVVEITGESDALPEMQFDRVTGEMINKHQHATSLNIVFRGKNAPRHALDTVPDEALDTP